MDKYRVKFLKQAGDTLREWAAAGRMTDHAYVYRFLHSLKGTSGTLGLPDWHDASRSLLEQLPEERERKWTAEELSVLLRPLFSLLRDTGDAVRPEHVDREHRSAVQEDGRIPVPTAGKEAQVLLVDDDPGLLQVMKDSLESRRWEVLAASRADQALEWFYERKPDCVVLDIFLEEHSGFDVLERIRTLSEQYLIPVILISGKDDLETRLKAYDSGADDFISKPFDLDEFAARVQRQIQRRKRISKLLLQDELTGAYNFTFLAREWERDRKEREGTSRPSSLALLDLDHFRDINASFGYAEGDALLKQFAAFVKERLTAGMLLAREGADRFALLMPGMRETEAGIFLNKLLREFAGTVHTAGFRSYRAACSAGTVEIGQEDGWGACMDRASHALLFAKKSGGGSCQIYRAEGGSEGATGISVVVIDDDNLIRTMLLKQLNDLEGEEFADIRGYRDGEEYFADAERPSGRQLLILDRMMPRMNGMEVLSRIRSLPDSRNYTVLMLTGVGEEREIAEAITAGTDDYMTKPFSWMELEARIRRLLGRMRR